MNTNADPEGATGNTLSSPGVNYPVFRFLCRVLAALLIVVAASNALAQELPPEGRPRATAVRVAAGAIRLDGQLDEALWRDAPPMTNFVQKEPSEGEPPSDPMTLRFAYDNDALYVGARMDSNAPVRAPLGRRDSNDQAEHLLVSLDTYFDRRTSYTFGITAAGVRIDRYYASDDEDAGDDGFSPVWQARVSVDAGGWTAEMRIPFSQIRFNDRDPLLWGLNVQRIVPAQNEEVFWVLIPRTESRWASLFGELHGITGIQPRRRLELLPYVAGGSTIIGDRDERDPFTTAANLDGRVGLDAKMGLGSNLTLEAAVNPDFGQVEADPAEVNLSAVETFFAERRPFFLEGSDLLSGVSNNFYYSRRIGAAPPIRPSGEFVDQPRASTILGAAKLSGRLVSGTSIGVLGAVTGEESARTFSTGAPIGSFRVAPRSAYGVGRVEQEFGPPGSVAGMMATFVSRDLPEGDPLAAAVVRQAATVNGDIILRMRDGEYEARGFFGGSHIAGDAAAIDRVQRSSAHYYQRPDAPYPGYDPTRTSLTGIKSGWRIERRTGRHWNWSYDGQIESAGFESNDLGRLSSADGMEHGAEVSYRETVPGRWYRNYQLQLRHERRFTYEGIRRQGSWQSFGSITWPNFWQTELNVQQTMRAQDERLTRGGPLMGTPRGWSIEFEGENNDASRTRVEFGAEYGRNEDGGLVFGLATDWTIQPGSRWELSVEPSYVRQVDVRQYLTTLPGGSAATFGRRYVFGQVDRSTYATSIRLNYTFKPDLTLDLYAEPFAASGRYSDIGELLAARSRRLRLYGTDGTTLETLLDGTSRVGDGEATFDLRPRDFNVQSFRSNVVLRWEWRLGSTLFLVWQQDRASDEIARDRVGIGDMFDSLRATGDNFFVVKASYWFSPD